MNLNWTPVITPNVTLQRASKRRKSVGGAFDITGFTPSNDMGTGISAASTTVLDNVVYEFKVENICTTGGPTINNNGIKEQIKFACIIPQLSSTGSTITANVSLFNTDITKVIYNLYKQSDSSFIGTQTVTRAFNAASHTFTGLIADTGYYVTVELIAVIETVERNSADVAYLGSPCGGNVTNYQIDTDLDIIVCEQYINSTPSPISGIYYDDCSGSPVLTTVNPGQQICAFSGSLTGGSGLTLLPPDGFCTGGGSGSLVMQVTSSGQIDSVSNPVGWFVDSISAFPVTSANPFSTSHIAYTGTLSISCTTSVNSKIRVIKNGTLHICVAVAGAGAGIIFSVPVTINATDSIVIELALGNACP